MFTRSLFTAVPILFAFAAGVPSSAPTSAEALIDPPPMDGSTPASSTAPGPVSTLIAEGFVSIGEPRGIKVYRREKLPGLELAAEGDIAATPERVRRVLLDYPNHRRWQKHLKENRVLAQDQSSLDVYQRLGLPVLDDRDFTLHVTWGIDGAIPWVRFGAVNDRGPQPVNGVVRVTRHSGGWRLEPAAGGAWTHAVYRFHLDLAGSFPAWMAKGRAIDDMPELFENIRKELPSYP